MHLPAISECDTDRRLDGLLATTTAVVYIWAYPAIYWYSMLLVSITYNFCVVRLPGAGEFAIDQRFNRLLATAAGYGCAYPTIY